MRPRDKQTRSLQQGVTREKEGATGTSGPVSCRRRPERSARLVGPEEAEAGCCQGVGGGALVTHAHLPQGQGPQDTQPPTV